MNPSIRLVCSDCLRSVDPGDELLKEPLRCPRCGGCVESVGDDGNDASSEESPPISLGPDKCSETCWESPGTQSPTVEFRSMGQIDRFQIRELLGGGGFGRVYRAYDPRLDRDIALKVLSEQQPRARNLERFFREARAAAQLDHPHIVGLHDAGRDQGRCWIAYQYVAGQSLSRRCESGPLGIEQTARVIRALADALDHAHRLGVCHRDIKPANVLIDAEGRPRLTDFGLAKRMDIASSLTKEGAILGTPAYMSPEQAAGFGHLADARSDIYSLGVTMYELLSGRRPVDLPSGVPAWRTIQEITRTDTYRPPSAYNAQVPRALDRICRRALALDPADRYPSAQALAQDLDAWLRRPRWDRRLILVALSLLVLVAGVTVTVRLLSLAGPASASDQLTTAGFLPPEPIPPEPPPSPPPVLTAESVIGNSESLRYHRPSCSSLKIMSDKRRRVFPSAQEAQQAGYSQCGACSKHTAGEAPAL